jgi:DNA-directed RNA polymerase specialized sigma subunit
MASRGGSANAPSSLGNSPEKHMLSRQLTMESGEGMESPEQGQSIELEQDYDDYDDDDDDDDEDEDEEDEEDVQPTSQYISALDLAGY